MTSKLFGMMSLTAFSVWDYLRKRRKRFLGIPVIVAVIPIFIVKKLGMVEATIGDLALANHSSRGSDGVRRRGCIEHDFDRGLEIRTIMGTKARLDETGS
jgi:hypothetical protein